MLRSRASIVIALGIIVMLAAAVRFWRLQTPPSWLDESVTALIAAGRGPDALPNDRVVPLQRVADLFDPHLTATAADALAVFYDPRVQDLHPPTYHLLANAALRAGFYPHWLLVPRVRALAALFGILAVVATYIAARQAFDRRTALTAASLVAVSPYAVMLSREARNYSAATLAIACSLGAFLALARRIENRKPAAGSVDRLVGGLRRRPVRALLHAVCIRRTGARACVPRLARWLAVSFRSLAIACSAVLAAFAPWIPTLVAQQASPEQRWLTFAIYGSSPFEVPYKIASAFQTMLLGKAWDLGQPTYDITRGIALVVYLCVLGAIAVILCRTSSEQRAARIVFALAGLTIVEYVAAMALQRKDFVSEVRYQYAYYVPLAVGVAWVFARLPVLATVALLAMGLVNSVMVDLDVESWKGTDPPPVLARLEGAPQPTLFVEGSGSFNETVVYETILYEFLRRRGVDGRSVAVVQRTPLYASFDIHANPTIFWDAVALLRPDVMPASIMIHSSGMLPNEYRKAVTITSASGSTSLCSGIGLDDVAFATDNTLIRPLYRRYVCDTRRASAGR